MPSLVQPRALDLSDALPEKARAMIKQWLADEPTATRKVYASLARKVWSLLIERRFDDEIRDWHGLLHSLKAHLRDVDDAAAERVTALADLLRESISLAQSNPAREIASRPRARSILEALKRTEGFVPRRVLMNSLGMNSSHLSNVLTTLSAHNLIDRRGKGKEAEFRLTALGRQLLRDGTKAASTEAVQQVGLDAETFEQRLRAITTVPLETPRWVRALEPGDHFFPKLLLPIVDHGPLDLTKVMGIHHRHTRDQTMGRSMLVLTNKGMETRVLAD